MPDIPEIFITFPITDLISLSAGTTSLNFIDGIAILTDRTERPLAGRITRERPLKSISTYFSKEVNIILTLSEEIQYQGRIPAGFFEINNVTYDSCEIITTETINSQVIASTSKRIVSVPDSRAAGTKKSAGVQLLPITAIAANANILSSELDLTGIDYVTIYMDHARDAVGAFVGAGTEYRILVSPKSSGDDSWVPINSVVCGITAPTAIVMDAAEAAGATVIEIGANTPAVGDYVFFKNTNLANSEWGKVVAITAGVDFTLLHALSHAQGSAAFTIYNQAEKFILDFTVKSFLRLKVVVNNNNGTTNQNIVSRIYVTTGVE